MDDDDDDDVYTVTPIVSYQRLALKLGIPWNSKDFPRKIPGFPRTSQLHLQREMPDYVMLFVISLPSCNCLFVYFSCCILRVTNT